MNLHHRILGEGIPVFIFHGLFGMNDNWQSFGKQLAELGFQTVLTDLRNHGHSPHADSHNYTGMAEDIAELMHTFDGPRFAIGHSMGGKALLQTLNLFPGLVHAAVVVDIAPWKYLPRHNVVTEALNAVDVITLADRKSAEAVLMSRLNDVSTVQFLTKNLYRTGSDQFSWRFNLATIINNIHHIGEDVWPGSPVNTPVLFVRGERSDYIEPERFGEILTHYPNAELADIPDAGHWIHAEQPKAMLALVADWLKKHTQPFR
ncbi:MAG: alpha/beta fold hydrolase [Bacteroidota bacterium]